MDVPDAQALSEFSPQAGVSLVGLRVGQHDAFAGNLSSDSCDICTGQRVFPLSWSKCRVCKPDAASPAFPPPCLTGIESVFTGNVCQRSDSHLLEACRVLGGVFAILFFWRPLVQDACAVEHRENAPHGRGNFQPCIVIWAWGDVAQHLGNVCRCRFDWWTPHLTLWHLVRHRDWLENVRCLHVGIVGDKAKAHRVFGRLVQSQPVLLTEVEFSGEP